MYVYFGATTGLPSTPSVTLHGAGGTNSLFGTAVAGGCDFDGDGYADILAGDQSVATFAGQLNVFRGGASGTSASAMPQLAGSDGASSEFGASVACAGDVNDDGYPDALIGAPGATGGGRVHVLFGAATPLATGAVLSSTTANLFRSSVAGAGDTNGDGYADVIVGSPGENGTSGRAYLFHGAPAATFGTSQSAIAPVNLHGLFGSAVAGPGDLDGDGDSDILVSALLDASGLGMTYVFTEGGHTLASPWQSLSSPDGDVSFGVSIRARTHAAAQVRMR